ncbi:hypothetical protein [Dactylosporangium darangshiense]|uniref:hypothetical protein n=1 Tax=Dactylosporangium darangshiense TaxID=579108 RepID=UPI00362A2F77
MVVLADAGQGRGELDLGDDLLGDGVAGEVGHVDAEEPGQRGQRAELRVGLDAVADVRDRGVRDGGVAALGDGAGDLAVPELLVAVADRAEQVVQAARQGPARVGVAPVPRPVVPACRHAHPPSPVASQLATSRSSGSSG